MPTLLNKDDLSIGFREADFESISLPIQNDKISELPAISIVGRERVPSNVIIGIRAGSCAARNITIGIRARTRAASDIGKSRE